MRSIALYGRSGSGKSTVAGFLVAHGYHHVMTGEACRWVCRELFGSETKEIMNRVSDAMMAIDPRVWLNVALRQAHGKTPVVFDSVRFPHDYETLRSQGFFMVKLVTSRDVRLVRLRHRGQAYTVRDEVHRVEHGLDDRPFDAVISNDGTLDELRSAVASLMSSLGRPRG